MLELEEVWHLRKGDMAMQHIRIITMLLSIVGVLLTSAAFAASADGTAAKGTSAVGSHVHKASAVIGSRVENPQGESLGMISDIVLDPDAGHIKYVTLSYGGVLGLGGKLFAVAWDALTLQSDNQTYLLNISQELLEATPGFDKNHWPQQPDAMLQAAAIPAESIPPSRASQAARSAPPMSGPRTEYLPSATVADLDAQQGSISLTTRTGETLDLRAPAALLAGLQTGDVVEVSRSGNAVTKIRKRSKQ
jgi:sporulation protein YlmC with PRC-barrel domain